MGVQSCAAVHSSFRKCIVSAFHLFGDVVTSNGVMFAVYKVWGLAWGLEFKVEWSRLQGLGFRFWV